MDQGKRESVDASIPRPDPSPACRYVWTRINTVPAGGAGRSGGGSRRLYHPSEFIAGQPVH